jgi:hypothetical protein
VREWLRRMKAMKSLLRPVLAAGLSTLAATVAAQSPAAAPPNPAAVARQSASPAGPAASAAEKAEPASTTRVIEDDRVRIEETRVRGQVQRVTVRSKLTGQDYEIIVGPGGRDPSQKADAAGQRAWSVFRF